MRTHLRSFFLGSILFTISLFFAHTASANTASLSRLKIVTTTTDLAWIASRIGQDRVDVESLLSPNDDPHFVDVRPDYVAKITKADVVCLIGLDLEIGWMPKVLRKSGRKHLQPGGSGYCELGKRVEALDKPKGPIDRSMGDVHPSGNPHYWLSPHTFVRAAEEIVSVLSALRPEDRTAFTQNYQDLQKEMNELEKNLNQKLRSAGIRDSSARYIQYHKEFEYFAQSFGLKGIAEIEDKPGIKPSAARLAELSQLVRKEQIKIILASTHASQSVIRKFEELTGLKVNSMPVSLSSYRERDAYNKLIIGIVDRLVEVNSKSAHTHK